MPKLVTPIQYEPVLDGLNDVRPLQVSKQVRRVIDISVANSLPVDSKNSALGTLVKSTQLGSLAGKLRQGFTKYELHTFDIKTGNFVYTYTFSQQIYKLLLVPYFTSGVWAVWLMDPTFIFVVWYIGAEGSYEHNIHTNKAYIKIFGALGVEGFIDMYGFYN